MNEDSDEEHGVEVWDGRCCADAKTPGKTLDPVRGIVLHAEVSFHSVCALKHFAYRFASVCPPATGQEAVTISKEGTISKCNWDLEMQSCLCLPVFSLDVCWVLDGAPWELRERLAPFECSLRLHLEAALLRHRGIEAEVMR